MSKLGSSSNANKDPYVKFGFKGTEECQKSFKKMEERQQRVKSINTFPFNVTSSMGGIL